MNSKKSKVKGRIKITCRRLISFPLGSVKNADSLMKYTLMISMYQAQSLMFLPQRKHINKNKTLKL